MFIIEFHKFNEQGIFRGSKRGTKKYTKRKAIDHLKHNGFKPMFLTMKLPSCFYER